MHNMAHLSFFVCVFRVLGVDNASKASVLEEKAYGDLHKPAVMIGGCFALAAVVVSLFLIRQHLRSYTNPAEQKWIVAILFMVPVYASESLLSLWNPKLSLACDILRNCYEAFALYSFGSYLIACLGGERKTKELLENKSREQLGEPLLVGVDENQVEEKGWFSNFFFRPCVLGKDLLSIEKFGLVQYMILKTVCAFLAFLLELFGVYGDGEFKWYYGYPYIAVVLNFSQMWALYCLIKFYNVTHERLHPIKPLAKFISFKAIVFATWWQGVGIALLCALGVLPKEGKLKNGLQDFLICIEMAIAAVAHMFVFSAEHYHHHVSPCEHGKVTAVRTKEAVTLEEGGQDNSAVVEKTETQIKSPGTSITESVQEIVVEGGHRVVEDVVLTINQAIGPVEKGMTKIQERFHQKSSSWDGKEEETDLEVEEHVEEDLTIFHNTVLSGEKDN